MKKRKQLIDVLMPFLVAVALALALAMNGCAGTAGDVPCELIKCTDYSSADDAWDNGVFNELCGMRCQE